MINRRTDEQRNNQPMKLSLAKKTLHLFLGFSVLNHQFQPSQIFSNFNFYINGSVRKFPKLQKRQR